MAQSNTSKSLFDTELLAGLKGARVAIVYTEWNEHIVNELIAGCERVLGKFDAEVCVKVAAPGAFELPYTCKRIWEYFVGSDKEPEAIIAFGAVIRGGTPHFEYVSKAVTDGILQLNLSLKVPIIFGVLTLDTEAQAQERLGGQHGHKGEEAALTALKMIAMTREHQY